LLYLFSSLIGSAIRTPKRHPDCRPGASLAERHGSGTVGATPIDYSILNLTTAGIVRPVFQHNQFLLVQVNKIR
jgi:hypothetical protein